MGDDGSGGSVDDEPAGLDEALLESDLPNEALADAIAAADGVAPPAEREERIDALEREVEALDEDLAEKIEDLRARVLQVRDMARDSGDGDGDHAGSVTRLAEEYEALETDLAAVAEDLSALEDDVDAGFQNYEQILEELSETTRRLEARLETVARVTRRTRETLDRVAGEQSERTQMESLAEAANRAGVRSARCAACSTSLDIALLTRPRCPDCGTTFADVEPAQGFFGSATLTTGSPPALAPGEEDRTDPIEEMGTDPTTDT